MEDRKDVLRQILVVLLGEAIGTALMIGVFALMGKFSLGVVFGGLIGMAVSFGNFFFLAVSVSLAADKAARDEDVQGGQKMIRLSYLLRYAVMFLVLFLCAKSGYFNIFSLVIPLLFVRPTIMLYEFFRKSGDTEK